MEDRTRANTKGFFTYRQVNLMNLFRRLWVDHSIWTRSFIVSTAANSPDLPFVTKRLLRNPTDFANELKPFYGNVKASEFEKLLREHLLLAGKLIGDVRSGNTKVAEETRRRWYSNADEIAAFLASINPNWGDQEWKRMMYDHLMMVENEAMYRLTGQYPADIAEFDHMLDHTSIMADMMSKGIIKQFRV
ncbi:MAG TPA: acetylglutamate kinase [Oscillospiraceae bacterium]|nr:acetylglutamate kinase [Oscillospiraceae bacterium]